MQCRALATKCQASWPKPNATSQTEDARREIKATQTENLGKEASAQTQERERDCSIRCSLLPSSLQLPGAGTLERRARSLGVISCFCSVISLSMGRHQCINNTRLIVEGGFLRMVYLKSPKAALPRVAPLQRLDSLVACCTQQTVEARVATSLQIEQPQVGKTQTRRINRQGSPSFTLLHDRFRSSKAP